MSGFGNEFASEALEGALPKGRNSPQKCPFGLYAEQFSGTAFTAPRAMNRRSWLYRIRPAVTHHEFERLAHPALDERREESATPNQLRWDPLPIPTAPTDFIEGLVPIAGNGSPEAHAGCGIYLYAANRPMRRRFFYDADGEMLLVPQQGTLLLDTELGRMVLQPQEIARHPPRPAISSRAARRRRTRLYLRELRSALQIAGPGTHRLQWTGERARFPHPGRTLRGYRDRTAI